MRASLHVLSYFIKGLASFSRGFALNVASEPTHNYFFTRLRFYFRWAGWGRTISADFNRCRWISQDFSGFSWISLDADFCGFHWIPVDFIGFHWISVDFI